VSEGKEILVLRRTDFTRLNERVDHVDIRLEEFKTIPLPR